MVSFLIFCFILILIFLLIIIIILINRYLQFPEAQPLLSFVPRCHFLSSYWLLLVVVGKKIFDSSNITSSVKDFLQFYINLNRNIDKHIFFIYHHFTSCIKFSFVRYLVVNKKCGSSNCFQQPWRYFWNCFCEPFFIVLNLYIKRPDRQVVII